MHCTFYRTPPIVTHFKLSYTFDSLNTQVIYHRHTDECQQRFLERKWIVSSVFYSPSSKRLRKNNILSWWSHQILIKHKQVPLIWASELRCQAHHPKSLLRKRSTGSFLKNACWVTITCKVEGPGFPTGRKIWLSGYPRNGWWRREKKSRAFPFQRRFGRCSGFPCPLEEPPASYRTSMSKTLGRCHQLLERHISRAVL